MGWCGQLTVDASLTWAGDQWKVDVLRTVTINHDLPKELVDAANRRGFLGWAGEEGISSTHASVRSIPDALQHSILRDVPPALELEVIINVPSGRYVAVDPPGPGHVAFTEVVSHGVQEIILRGAMDSSLVKHADMWRLSLASRFTALHLNDKSRLRDKCACVASFCPSFLRYLEFFRANMHNVNRPVAVDIVRYGHAFYVLQRRIKEYVWRPEGRLCKKTMAEIV